MLSARGAKRVLAWDEKWLNCRGLAEALRAAGVTLEPCWLPRDAAERRQRLAELDDIGVGLTGAVAGLADTGSLALRSGPGRGRIASLLPPLHIAMLRVSQLTSYAAFLAAHPQIEDVGSNLVLVTGPSRTGYRDDVDPRRPRPRRSAHRADRLMDYRLQTTDHSPRPQRCECPARSESLPCSSWQPPVGRASRHFQSLTRLLPENGAAASPPELPPMPADPDRAARDPLPDEGGGNHHQRDRPSQPRHGDCTSRAMRPSTTRGGDVGARHLHPRRAERVVPSESYHNLTGS